jgi:uncharacterized cupredoxin-like copper-binding protein
MLVARHALLVLCAAALSYLPTRSDADEIIGVKLLGNTIQLDTDRAKAGDLTFNVTNSANEAMSHELVVLRTDLSDAKLPMKAGQVEEGKFKKMGEVEDVMPGKSKQFKLNLAPGHYVLICNRPGHYAMGMHAALVVTR